MEPEKPNVIISACLLGRQVRYNGQHKFARFLVEELSPRVHWLAVCPEVEIGLGVPRPPIDLYGDPTNPALLQAVTGLDLTERMQAWIEIYLEKIAKTRIHGAILKGKSPSCGLDNVRLYSVPDVTIDQDPNQVGQGLFAANLLARFPEIPIVQERDLQTEKGIQAFLGQLV
jgi:uncharacterized protein YbbK (DUF523 family)